MSISDRMKKLVEGMVEEEGESPELLELAKHIVLGTLGSAPEDDDEAAEALAGMLRQLVTKKTLLIRAYKLMRTGTRAGKAARMLIKTV